MKNRLARVCEVLKREISSTISRELNFGGVLVTVSGVDVTPDLRKAHVFVSAIGGESVHEEILEKLQGARLMLQQELASRVVLKNTPQLHFHIDHAIERGSRVLDIMDELGLEIGNQSRKKS